MLQPQSFCCLGMAVLFTGCEGRDQALQQELAELRERTRVASEEADAAKARLAGSEFKSLESLKASLEAASKKLGTDLAAAFPGYRTESVTASEIVFVLGEKEAPYRTTLEFRLKPSSPSALTPEMPPVITKVGADPAGVWKMPGQPQLREMQAAASAKATAQAQRQADPRPASHPPSPPTQPTAQTPQAPPQPPSPSRQPAPHDPSARVISWGDERPAPSAPSPEASGPPPAETQSVAPPQQHSQQPPRAPTSVPGQPAAGQTYEIRFD